MKGLFFGVPLGITSTFWFIAGFLRAITEGWQGRKKKRVRNKYKISDIAIIIPAHNEEKAIVDCIRAVKQSADSKDIYVASDGSTDKTWRRARAEGCRTVNIMPGKGKAKAIVHTLKTFKLFQRYKFIMILDADTRIDKTYLPLAIPLFNDPEVSVVFPTARIHWPDHKIPRKELYYIAYRERLNRLLQYFFMYGQTWKYLNASYVAPGFATVYRSRILRKLEIDTPGLLIEDFNLAFQLHKRRLGKMGYHPDFVGWDQHPNNLKDYWNQVERWNIGFFQTVRRNGVWPSFFYLSMVLFSIEVWLNSFFVLLLPLLVLYHLGLIFPSIPILGQYSQLYQSYGIFTYIPLTTIVLGIFVFDYLMTVVIGIMTRKPQFAIYGLFFFIMHYITSLILISSIIPGFFGRSNGRWVSPKRLDRNLVGAATP